MEFPFAWFHSYLTCLIADYCYLTASTCMPVICAIVPLFIVCYMCQLIVFVEVASGGFYFGCKVKHLLSCSVSTGSVQQVIIALVYSVNVCQMDAAAAACAGTGPPSEKRKRKRRKHFWFPPSVLLQWSTVDSVLFRGTW